MGGLLVDTDSACVGSNNLAIPGPYNAGEVAGKGIACLRMSFSCVTLRCSPTHERNHNPSVGVRIGEAAHPGPFPDESDDEAGGLLAGLDLKSMLLPLITKLIKKAIADLLKDESILASVRGLQKPTTHAARGATGPKEGPERQIAKGKGAQSRSHGKGGPDVRVSEHKNSGRGAKAPAEEFRPHPTRGKGKGNAAAHEASSWTVVARKSKDADAVFQLRAQDWNAPLLSFAGLGAQIEKTKSGESIQGVLMASKAELTTAHSMLKSSAKPYSVLLICLEKGPKSQRIPGRVGDTLRFRDAIVEQVTNDERLARAAPKDMKDPYKVKQLQTSLLYMRIPKIFATDTVWQEFKTGPERASMKWASAHHVQGIDAFGWVEEQIKNAQGTQLFGILRVPTADVGTLLGVSGQNGVFTEPARKDAHRFRMEWVSRTSKQETDDHYLQRALRGAPALGLAVFAQRIAWRQPIVDGEVLSRVWCINNVPKEWHGHELTPVLEQGFRDVTWLSHRHQRGTLSFRFRATCLAGDKDLVPLQAKVDDGDPVVLWAAVAPPRAVQAKQRRLTRGAVPFVSPCKATSLDAQPKQAGGTETTATDDNGKPISEPKRARGAARSVPEGLERRPCDTDGNCAFYSIAEALTWLSSKSGTDAYNHIELRARAVAHLTKHRKDYETEWDGVLPDGTANKTFDDYLAAAAQLGSLASELELQALSRIYDTRIMVLPASDCFLPMVFHTSQKRKMIVLWLQDKHLEFLKPTKKDSNCRDYPAEFWSVTDGPVRGLRVGGGSVRTSATSTVRSGTVFTRTARTAGSSSVRSGTVWTNASDARVGVAAGSPSASASVKCSRSVARSPADASASASVFTGKGPVRRTASRKLRASAKTSQAVGHGDADDASQDLSGCEPELPRKAKPAPCSHRAPVLRPADGIFRCRLCPFQRATAHLAQYRQVNTQHYKCHHGGATLPGPLRRPRVGQVSGGAKNRFWKCPRCTQGVSKEVRASITRHVFLRCVRSIGACITLTLRNLSGRS